MNRWGFPCGLLYYEQVCCTKVNKTNGINTVMAGGEGGIRTPDGVTPMPDFESGAFNRALPPLHVYYQ
jgi:hypothetical protein